MRIAKWLLGILAFLPAAGWAMDLDFEEARRLWIQTHGLPGYVEYMAEFIRFHNSHHLDERDNCHALLTGPLQVILVLSKGGVVLGVATSTNDAGASCFRRVYDGLEVQPPPYAPFAIRMTLGRGFRI